MGKETESVWQKSSTERSFTASTTYLLENGYDIRVVQKLLEYKDVETTIITLMY
jgi:site-specific recombinase XerD